MPGTSFDRAQDDLHGVPPELTTMFHELVAEFDILTISSRDARRGPLGPVPRGPLASTFSFSSIYANALSSKATIDEYRLVAQQHIINNLQRITVNVEDMQFTNALRLLRTLSKRGKLPEFLQRPDESGTPNMITSHRSIIFRHRITKNFPIDSARIEKWCEQVHALENSNAKLNMRHTIVSIEDSDAIRCCFLNLGDADRMGLEEKGLITRCLNFHLCLVDYKKARDSKRAKDDMEAAREYTRQCESAYLFRQQGEESAARLMVCDGSELGG